MDREAAIRKVLRCLRLAKSANPHEAAAALRQARSLMDLHGLSEADAYASEIHSEEARTRSRGSVPPQSLAILINLVARAFRCRPILRTGFGKTDVAFFGSKTDATVAAYAFTVLRRTLEGDKAKHTRRIRKRSNKEARGEAFAIGWCMAVNRMLQAPELPADRAAAIDAAIDQLGRPESCESRELTKHGRTSDADRWAGFAAGQRAKVNAGLTESEQPRLEHSL